jgi:hypothetical protein
MKTADADRAAIDKVYAEKHAGLVYVPSMDAWLTPAEVARLGNPPTRRADRADVPGRVTYNTAQA